MNGRGFDSTGKWVNTQRFYAKPYIPFAHHSQSEKRSQIAYDDFGQPYVYILPDGTQAYMKDDARDPDPQDINNSNTKNALKRGESSAEWNENIFANAFQRGPMETNTAVSVYRKTPDVRGFAPNLSSLLKSQTTKGKLSLVKNKTSAAKLKRSKSEKLRKLPKSEPSKSSKSNRTVVTSGMGVITGLPTTKSGWENLAKKRYNAAKETGRLGKFAEMLNPMNVTKPKKTKKKRGKGFEDVDGTEPDKKLPQHKYPWEFTEEEKQHYIEREKREEERRNRFTSDDSSVIFSGNEIEKDLPYDNRGDTEYKLDPREWEGFDPSKRIPPTSDDSSVIFSGNGIEEDPQEELKIEEIPSPSRVDTGGTSQMTDLRAKTNLATRVLRELNKRTKRNFAFAGKTVTDSIVSATQQVVSGMMYTITLRLSEEGDTDVQSYQCKVWEQRWLGKFDLQSVKVLAGPTSGSGPCTSYRKRVNGVSKKSRCISKR